MKRNDEGKNKIEKLYFIMFFIGCIMLLIAVLPVLSVVEDNNVRLFLTGELFNNILVSLSCGFIASTLVAYFIDKNNRRILDENNIRMKRNILIDVNDSIREYNNNNIESHRMNDFIKIDFVSNISESCEASIPLGIGFYSINEVLILKKVVYWSKAIVKHFDDNNLVDFYKKYEKVFSVVVTFEFKDGPYSEESSIEQICIDNNLDYDDKVKSVIGETVYLFKKFNVACSEFSEEFSYLNTDLSK